MAVLLTNSASTLLASSINDTDLALAVTNATGSLFPSPTGSDWFPLVVVASTGEREIMRCTARSGDVLTVTRGQEGTAGRAFDPGARVDLRVTAAVFDAIADDLGDVVDAAVTTLQGQLNAPSTTRMTFNQTAAPTGWVKESNSAYNDAVVVSTTGTVDTDGSVGAATLFARTATDGHALTQAQLPSVNLSGSGSTNTTGAHTHSYNDEGTGSTNRGQDGISAANTNSSNKTTGSSGDHSHTVTVTVPLGGSGSEHQHNIDMRVKRYSVIVAQKS